MARSDVIIKSRKPKKHLTVRQQERLRKPDLRESHVQYSSSPSEPTTIAGYKKAIRSKISKAKKDEKIEVEQLMKKMPLAVLKDVHKNVSVSMGRVSW